MSSHQPQTAIIIGCGPFISRSLSLYLARQDYKFGLISRTQSKLDEIASEVKERHNGIDVFTHAADAGDAVALAQALDTVSDKLGGKIDVLVYNAARVGPDHLMELDPATLEQDFKTCAVGTLVAGQWFSKNANKARHPLLLITGGTLDRDPNADYASLSAAKAASQSISVMFSRVLPDKHGILVGTPLIVEPIIPDDNGGGYVTKSDPDLVVQKIFKPYFDARQLVPSDWVVERIY